MIPMYRSQYGCYTEPCASGDGTEPEFEYDSSGELQLVGRTNVQDLIQSHLEECDLGYIMSRALNGDQSALNARVGEYIDTVDMPETFVDAFNMGQVAAEAKRVLSPEDLELLEKDPQVFAEQLSAKNADKEKAELLARLKQLTGKEVKIDE